MSRLPAEPPQRFRLGTCRLRPAEYLSGFPLFPAEREKSGLLDLCQIADVERALYEHYAYRGALGDVTMSLIIRLFLFLAAPIAALFVARDSLNFQIAQTFFAMLLLVAIGVVAAFWTARKKT
ncbi:hypothetical protein [Labrys neptuniae]